jgi:molybdate transport system substrate-binding protein
MTSSQAPLAPLLLLACSSPERPPLQVMAAASLTDVLPTVAAAWEQQGGAPVRFTFDGTSRLAKQLEAGAPADLLLSADEVWTTWAIDHGLLDPSTRRDLLGGSLVAIVPAAAPFVPTSPADLADPRLTRLGLAGESVPAGRYARASLSALGAWDGVAARVVNGDSVRSVLGWVAAGEVEVGVVYATDARVEPRVRVAFVLPPTSHPPIRYPAAVTTTSRQPDQAAALLRFLAGPEARSVFEQAGFEVL